MTLQAAVVDASTWVDLLLGTERRSEAARILGECVLHAPAHMDAEVLSALARLVRAEQVDPQAADSALAALRAAPVTRHPLIELVDDSWRARDTYRVTDGLYVALADRLDLPLVTSDARLARACRRAVLVARV